jgi:hypothetical protein
MHVNVVRKNTYSGMIYLLKTIKNDGSLHVEDMCMLCVGQVL